MLKENNIMTKIGYLKFHKTSYSIMRVYHYLNNTSEIVDIQEEENEVTQTTMGLRVSVMKYLNQHKILDIYNIISITEIWTNHHKEFIVYYSTKG